MKVISMRLEIDEKLRMLAPVIGEAKTTQFRKLYFYETDPKEKREIESIIDMKVAQLVKKTPEDCIILPPPPSYLCEGDIPIGKVEYLGRSLHPFSLNTSDLNRHMFIAGATGSGKTTLALNLIRQLKKKGIPILVIDWETSYRCLAQEFDDFEVFTVGKDIHPIHINFLEVPPGISKEEYTKSLIALISEDYLSGAGSDTMFLQYITTAFNELNQPRFEDLKQIIIREIHKDMKGRGRLSGRSGLWKETVQRITQFLALGAISNVIGSRHSYPIGRLLEQNAVLEFGGVKSPRDRKFLIHVLLNYISLLTQAKGIMFDHLTNVIVMEEFHNMAIKGSEDNMVSAAFREIRKYGFGLVTIDQEPSAVPNVIFGNCNVKACFRVGTRKDSAAMANAMNLDPFKARFTGMLKTGEAIMHAGQRYHEPFTIRPPFTRQTRNVTDEELLDMMSRFPSPYSSADFSADDLTDSTVQNPGVSLCSQTSQHDETSLSSLERVMLQSIIERPLDSMDERTKRLGIHSSQLAEIHTSLCKKGIIRTKTIDRKKLFDVTPFGRDAAKESGIPVQSKKGRGGIEHDYWTAQIVQTLRKLGFQPVLEFAGFDISDMKAGIAIEIETGSNNTKDIIANLEKLASSGFTHCFALVTSRPALSKIMELGNSYPSLTILYIKEFLGMSRESITSAGNVHHAPGKEQHSL